MRGILLALMMAVALAAWCPAAGAADFDGEMNAPEWRQFRARTLTPQPGSKPEPVPPAGYPGCPVCAGNPTCRSGYQQTGYTEMINFVVVKAWGDDGPGPGGYSRVIAKTITQNGVCVHDHVKVAVCNPR